MSDTTDTNVTSINRDKDVLIPMSEVLGKAKAKAKAKPKAKPKAKAKALKSVEVKDEKRDGAFLKSLGKPEVRTMEPGDLVLSEAKYQTRALNAGTVAEYADLMKGGTKFPNLTAHELGGKVVLVGGYHRHAAATKAGVKVKVNVYKGATEAQAMIHAISDNNSHGLPLRPIEKRMAVERMLKSTVSKAWSNGEIGRMVGMSAESVRLKRKALGIAPSTKGGTGNADRAKAKRAEYDKLNADAVKVVKFLARPDAKLSAKDRKALNAVLREKAVKSVVNSVMAKGEAHALAVLIGISDALLRG